MKHNFMKHLRFFFLLLFSVHIHNASSMQIDVEDVEQVRDQDLDIQNYRNEFLLKLTCLPCFDDWFYGNSVQDRIVFKKYYEEIAEELINSGDFEEKYNTLPDNYFSKVILNKVYYRQHQEFIDCPEIELDLSDGVVSTVVEDIFIDDYAAELVLEVLAELRDPEQVECLFLDKTKVTKLPENLYLFPNLSNITITNSNLSEVSTEICNSKMLEEIDFSYNPIKELPENIGQLENLKCLHLKQTCITEDEENRLREIFSDTSIQVSSVDSIVFNACFSRRGWFDKLSDILFPAIF